MEEILEDTTLNQGIKAIYKDKSDAATIYTKLGEIAAYFKALSETRLLNGESWETALALVEHYKMYVRKKAETFRLFSGEYHKANAFLQKHFQQKGIAWNDAGVPLLATEIAIFERFLAAHSEWIKFAFFADFQTTNILDGWEKWLEQKHVQFDAWRFIEGIDLFPVLKPVFKDGELDETKWETTKKVMEMLASFTDLLEESQKKWATFLHSAQIPPLVREIQTGNWQYAARLSDTLSNDFEDIKQLDGILANLTQTESNILAVLAPVIIQNTQKLTEEAEKQALVQAVRNSVYFAWIQQTEKQHPILAEVSTRGFVRKQEEYASILSNKRTALIQYILYYLKKRIAGNTKFDKNDNPVTFKEILHQVSKKRKLWTVRKLIHTYWEQGLSLLIPCWMASPESISAIFPMEENYFDLVIFDEASQCFVEKAIPVMMRGRQTVIAGDAKQLQPFDMYSVRYEEGEMAENEMALEVESLLDLAKNHMEEARLNWHYRSKEEELINFSNQAFYEGKLQVVPTAIPEADFLPPLEWVEVPGEWQNNRNEVEANRVIEVVLQWIGHPALPSIGIVTFNYFQQELIKDLLDKKLEEFAVSDPQKYEQLQAAIHKTENEEYMGLFVKNIENVQGDERDIMIFSIGYARNDKGKLTTQFGLLNLQGGENRLNVAITRARKKIYAVCSFNPSELATENTKYDGPKLLKSYLQYVKAVSENRTEEAFHILQSQKAPIIAFESNIMADYLENQLKKAGFYVIRNFGDTQYKIDLAVKQTEEDRTFLLAIECEGENYFSGETAKEREVYRRQLLHHHGWKTHRVWARNFWLNKDKEWEKIMEKLQPKTTDS